jgi:hypothetical protein
MQAQAACKFSKLASTFRIFPRDVPMSNESRFEKSMKVSLKDRIKEGGTASRCQKVYKAMINSNRSHRSDDPLASEKIQVDRKVFFLDLKENQRGRFLKITEDVSGRRDTIMLPASGFRDFVDALSRIVDLEERL